MTPRGSGLRPRERTIIRLLARNLGTADIARQLGVKPTTVRAYIRGIGEKWGTQDRAEIVATGRRLGVIQPTDGSSS